VGRHPGQNAQGRGPLLNLLRTAGSEALGRLEDAGSYFDLPGSATVLSPDGCETVFGPGQGQKTSIYLWNPIEKRLGQQSSS
jgi:hypothetical protein